MGRGWLTGEMCLVLCGSLKRGSLNSVNPKIVPVGTRHHSPENAQGGRSPSPHGILTVVDQPYIINRDRR